MAEIPSTTLHWSNADVEVHRVVVGAYDNNVFVIRCRQTGDAVLIDAANEHELLLELWLHELHDTFPEVAGRIGATGDLGAAMRELGTRHNASEPVV